MPMNHMDSPISEIVSGARSANTRTSTAASPFDYDLVVIGSGFGGTITALTVAYQQQLQGKAPKILILERGTWWTTPVPTVQDKKVAAFDFLKSKKQPVQFWSSAEH